MVRERIQPVSDDLSLRLRLKRWIRLLARISQRSLGFAKTVYVDQRVEEYRQYWSEAAKLLSAEFSELTDSVWEIKLDGRRTRIANFVTEADGPATLELVGDKRFCTELAKNLDIPVASVASYRLSQLGEAKAVLAREGGVFVVKPAKGSASALGITTEIQTAKELERAAVLASLFSSSFLLERMVGGESYRLIYVHGELVHAVRRRGVRAIGDGRSTIRELLRQLQLHDLEGDINTGLTLDAQRLSLKAVPESGRTVLVRGLPATERARRELRTIYDESITQLIGEELREELRTIVQAVGCEFVGVDIITTDPTVSLKSSGGVFLEMNTTPGIHHHYHNDDDRRYHTVPVRVLEHLLGVEH